MNNKINYLPIFNGHFLSTGLMFTGLALTLLITGFPNQIHAATYGYVNTSGDVVSVSANSPADAFSSSVNIARHSGVILYDNNYTYNNNSNTNNSGYVSGYMYVNNLGKVIYVDANTSAEAFSDSINISNRSGVMLISNSNDADMVGNQVYSY